MPSGELRIYIFPRQISYMRSRVMTRPGMPYELTDNGVSALNGIGTTMPMMFILRIIIDSKEAFHVTQKQTDSPRGIYQ